MGLRRRRLLGLRLRICVRIRVRRMRLRRRHAAPHPVTHPVRQGFLRQPVRQGSSEGAAQPGAARLRAQDIADQLVSVPGSAPLRACQRYHGQLNVAGGQLAIYHRRDVLLQSRRFHSAAVLIRNHQCTTNSGQCQPATSACQPACPAAGAAVPRSLHGPEIYGCARCRWGRT